MLSRSITLVLPICRKESRENKVSKRKEALQPAGNTFGKMGRAEQRACDQTSADTEEATAALPEDDTSAQEKNLRKQTVQGEKKKEKRGQIGRDRRRMMKVGKRRVERKGRGRQRGSEGRRLGWEARSRGGEKGGGHAGDFNSAQCKSRQTQQIEAD